MLWQFPQMTLIERLLFGQVVGTARFSMRFSIELLSNSNTLLKRIENQESHIAKSLFQVLEDQNRCTRIAQVGSQLLPISSKSGRLLQMLQLISRTMHILHRILAFWLPLK